MAEISAMTRNAPSLPADSAFSADAEVRIFLTRIILKLRHSQHPVIFTSSPRIQASLCTQLTETESVRWAWEARSPIRGPYVRVRHEIDRPPLQQLLGTPQQVYHLLPQLMVVEVFGHRDRHLLRNSTLVGLSRLAVKIDPLLEVMSPRQTEGRKPRLRIDKDRHHDHLPGNSVTVLVYRVSLSWCTHPKISCVLYFTSKRASALLKYSNVNLKFRLSIILAHKLNPPQVIIGPSWGYSHE